MNTKIALAFAALSCAPLAVAGDRAAYPKEKVAEFIVEKLDITSLPAAIRPKKEKGRKLLRIMDLRRRESTRMKPPSRRWAERRSYRSKFSTRGAREFTCALRSQGKVPAR